MRRPMDFNRTLHPLPPCFSHAPGNLVRLPMILLENRLHVHLVGKGAECRFSFTACPLIKTPLRSKVSAYASPGYGNLTECQATIVRWR